MKKETKEELKLGATIYILFTISLAVPAIIAKLINDMTPVIATLVFLFAVFPYAFIIYEEFRKWR